MGVLITKVFNLELFLFLKNPKVFLKIEFRFFKQPDFLVLIGCIKQCTTSR